MLNTYLDKETPDFLVEMAENCAVIQNKGEMDRLIRAGKETALQYGAVVCDAYSQ